MSAISLHSPLQKSVLSRLFLIFYNLKVRRKNNLRQNSGGFKENNLHTAFNAFDFCFNALVNLGTTFGTSSLNGSSLFILFKMIIF